LFFALSLNSTNNALALFVEFNSTQFALFVEFNSTQNALFVEFNSTQSALFVEFNSTQFALTLSLIFHNDNVNASALDLIRGALSACFTMLQGSNGSG
jgi:hypothetical protein